MTSDERIDRLEKVVQGIAEGQLALQKLIAELATETRKGFDAADRRMSRIEDQMSKSEERLSRDEARMRQTDERIEKLVIGIGEFTHRDGPFKT